MVVGKLGKALLDCEEKWMQYCKENDIENPYWRRAHYCHNIIMRVKSDFENPKDSEIEEYNKRKHIFMAKELYNLVDFKLYILWLFNNREIMENVLNEKDL